MNFSTKLMKLRKSRGLSQEELANEINVTRQTISKWELGTTIPDMEKLKLISNYFGVSVDELISETESNERQYSNNSEFIGVDEKYIPKQNVNDGKQGYVNKNKKSNKIFLIYLFPICIIIIVLIIIIFGFINSGSSRNMMKENYDEAMNTYIKTKEELKKTKEDFVTTKEELKQEAETTKEELKQEAETKKEELNQEAETKKEELNEKKSNLYEEINEFNNNVKNSMNDNEYNTVKSIIDEGVKNVINNNKSN